MKDRKSKAERVISYEETIAKGKQAAAALLSFGSVWALLWMLRIDAESLGYTNSIFAVFLFGALFALLRRALSSGFCTRRRDWFWPGLLGSAFSLCMVFGSRLELTGSVPFQNPAMWGSLVILGVLSSLILRYFWELMAARTGKAPAAHRGEEADFRLQGLLLYGGIILLCYLPVFLAVYPGFFVYDAQEELMEVVTRNFSTHHPLFHVLFLGGVIQLVYKITGSYNLGIACYTLLQMLLMAGIFGWCVEKVRAEGMGKAGRLLLTLYFGLCPVLVMFSLCSAKDGLFAGMLLIVVMLLREMVRRPERFWKQKGKVCFLAGALLLLLLLRHNGFYAFLAFVPAAAVYFRKQAKKLLPYLAGIAAVYLLASAAMTKLLGAENGENQEMLTVPIMQLARVYADEKEILPKEEKELLYRYLPEEALLRYTPKVSDGVKIDFCNEAFDADKGSFFRLWVKWGLQHPFTYLNAWFMTSYGFWYPDAVIDVYRGNTVFTYTYEDSSYFGYEVEAPGSRESKLPLLDELYRRMSLEIAQQKIPVVSMLFSPGFLFWVMAFFLGFFCYQKRYAKGIPFLLPLLCWLTVILGPTYLVRYVVFLWPLAPLLLWEAKFDN